ncbi:hypothetical protein DXG01_006368, partial [Tephrocybe rancida]
TCKHLQFSTTEQNVWMGVLREVCITHGVFLPTFPIASMDQKALEHAALVPYRFGRLLTAGKPPIVYPQATRVFLENKSLEGMEIEDIRLVPGGRFLLIKSDDSRVFLWDLGHSPASVVKPLPVASLTPEIDDLVREYCGIEPTDDGKGFYVVYKEHSSTFIQISVFVIYPLTPAPQFALVAVLPVPTHTRITHLLSGLCVIQSGSDYIIWDFICDHAVTWRGYEYGYDAVISHGHVLLFSDAGFTMWKIPEMSPLDGATPTTSSPQIPILNFKYHESLVDALYNRSKILALRSSWPYGRTRPSIISAMVSIEDEDFDYLTIAFYMMESIISTSGSTALPAAIPLFKASVDLGADDLDHRQESGRFADKWFIQPLHSRSSDIIAIVLDPTSETWEQHSTIISTDAAMFTLCPMSARLCILDPQKNVQIIDFVVPH